MNKKIYITKYTKESLKSQKKFYLFLFSLMIIGMIAGILFVVFSDKVNKKSIITNTTTFFSTVKYSVKVSYGKSLLNSILINTGYTFLIWLLGISIIGIPIIIGILVFKCFVFGFSISSIIASYGIKGILGAICYNFPHQVILLIVYLLLSFYALSFCYKLFCYLFLRKNINFKRGMKKYFKILIICLIINIIVSLYEVFLSTYFMKLFTLLIK
mgnify:FL=1